jgi:hypothetical protein
MDLYPNEVLTAKVAYLMNEGYTEKSSNEIGRIKTLPHRRRLYIINGRLT